MSGMKHQPLKVYRKELSSAAMLEGDQPCGSQTALAKTWSGTRSEGSADIR
jgi:hypothetical protein